MNFINDLLIVMGRLVQRKRRKRKVRTFRSRRAISPVIATVILVAVAITVAVAVAYWMGGIASQYTKFEKVEIQSGICVREAGDYWNITLKMKNTGTASATLIGVFINEVEVNTYNETVTSAPAAGSATTTMSSAETVLSGATSTINIFVDGGTDGWGAPVTSGTTINLKIHSAGGMDYIKLIELV